MVYGRRPKRAAATAGQTNYRELTSIRRSRKSTEQKYGHSSLMKKPGDGSGGGIASGHHHEYGNHDMSIAVNIRSSIDHPPVIPWVKVYRPASQLLAKNGNKSFLVEKFVKLFELTEQETQTLLTEKERAQYTTLVQKRKDAQAAQQQREQDRLAAAKLAAEQNGGVLGGMPYAGSGGGGTHSQFHQPHVWDNVPNVSHRRRCARCLQYGTIDQALACKGRSRRDFCQHFDQHGYSKKSAVIKRRCIRCINNGGALEQSLMCKGRSRKAFCIFFDDAGQPKCAPYVPPSLALAAVAQAAAVEERQRHDTAAAAAAAATIVATGAGTPTGAGPPLPGSLTLTAESSTAAAAAADALASTTEEFTLLPDFLEDAAGDVEAANHTGGTTTTDV